MTYTAGTWGIQFALKLVEYTIHRGPILKLSEAQEASSRQKNHSELSVSPKGDIKLPGAHKSYLSSASSFLYDAFELIFTWRGIGWQFGAETGVRAPPASRNVGNRGVFLLQTFISIIQNSLICDVAHTLIQLTPAGTPAGGSIFDFGGDNLVHKYAISTALHVLSGIVILFGMCSTL